jgi:hypothetical protein
VGVAFFEKSVHRINQPIHAVVCTDRTVRGFFGGIFHSLRDRSRGTTAREQNAIDNRSEKISSRAFYMNHCNIPFLFRELDHNMSEAACFCTRRHMIAPVHGFARSSYGKRREAAARVAAISAIEFENTMPSLTSICGGNVPR